MSKPKLSPPPLSLVDLHKMDEMLAQKPANFETTQAAAPQVASSQAVPAQSAAPQVEVSQPDARQDASPQSESSQVVVTHGDSALIAPTQGKSKKGRAVEVAPAPAAETVLIYGTKGRVIAYMEIEQTAQLKALARELERSESYTAGKLIAEALMARALARK